MCAGMAATPHLRCAPRCNNRRGPRPLKTANCREDIFSNHLLRNYKMAVCRPATILLHNAKNMWRFLSPGVARRMQRSVLKTRRLCGGAPSAGAGTTLPWRLLEPFKNPKIDLAAALRGGWKPLEPASFASSLQGTLSVLPCTCLCAGPTCTRTLAFPPPPVYTCICCPSWSGGRGCSPRGVLAVRRSQCSVAPPPCRPWCVHPPRSVPGVLSAPRGGAAGGAVPVAGRGQGQQAPCLLLPPGGRGRACPVGGALHSPCCEGQVESEQLALCTDVYFAGSSGWGSGIGV